MQLIRAIDVPETPRDYVFRSSRMQRGQTTAAVYMARKLYALDLTGATKFVKNLREGVQS